MWRTRLTQEFPCRLPIVGAPMADVSGGLLAAETCRAGGLGFIAGGHLSQQKYFNELEKQIAIFRKHIASIGHDDVPLCIGFIGFSTFGVDSSSSGCISSLSSSPKVQEQKKTMKEEEEEGWKNFQYVLQTYQPNVVQFFAPAICKHPITGQTNVDMAHQYNAKVLAQVGNVTEATIALEAGVDGLIAQGSESGGHGLRRELGNATFPLAARLVQLAKKAGRDNDDDDAVVVLAAGGIVDGRGLAAALAVGCDGAILGTRLWASKEAIGHSSYKQQLVTATSCDDVIRTTVFDTIGNGYRSQPWPKPYDSCGALRNETSNQWDENEHDRQEQSNLIQELTSNTSTLVSEYQKATKQGNPNIAPVLAGQGVGEIHCIESVYDIITRIDEESRFIVKNLSQLIVD